MPTAPASGVGGQGRRAIASGALAIVLGVAAACASAQNPFSGTPTGAPGAEHYQASSYPGGDALPSVPSDAEIDAAARSATTPHKAAGTQLDYTWFRFDNVHVYRRHWTGGKTGNFVFLTADKVGGITSGSYTQTTPVVCRMHWAPQTRSWSFDTLEGSQVDPHPVGGDDLLRWKTPAERDAWVKQKYLDNSGEGFGAGAALPAAPDRVEIRVTQAAVRDGQLHVAGTVASASRITASLLMRSEGGKLEQGQLQHDAGQFTGYCSVAPGVPNTFKITFGNEAGLGAESTLRIDVTGKVTTALSTTAEGDTTAQAPIPGMAGVGSVPGPGSLAQGVAGVLTPALIAILLRGVLGGVAGGTLRPPVPTKPRPTHPHDGQEERSADQQAKGKDAEQGVKRPPAAKGAGGAKAAVDQGLNRPQGALAIQQDADRWMGRLTQVSASTNPGLAAVLDDVRNTAFTPDGSVIPEKWAEARQRLRDAVVVRPEDGPGMLSTAGEYAKAAGRTAWQTAGEVGTGVWEYGKSVVWDKIGMPVSGIVDLAKLTAEVIHEPGKLIDDVQGIAGDAADRYAPFEKSEFLDAVGKGQYSRAALAVAMGAVRTTKDVAPTMAWEWAKEKLPIEEIQSIFTSEELGAETRLWAVAAAAVKIAALAADQIEPTQVPATSFGARLGATSGGEWINRAFGRYERKEVDWSEHVRQRLDAVRQETLSRRLGPAPAASRGVRMVGHVPTGASMQTPSGRRVFWSGKEGARAASEAGASIGDTELGAWAAQATEGRPWPEARQIWAQTSERFALGAEGDVDVYLQNGLRSDSVFNRNEVHVLLRNPSVRSVRIHVMREGKWELTRAVRALGG